MDTMALKEGDKVIRLLGGDLKMPMRVVKVTKDRIFCNAIKASPIPDGALDDLWQFDRATGVEEDASLGWGVSFGRTGSFLSEPIMENDDGEYQPSERNKVPRSH